MTFVRYTWTMTLNTIHVKKKLFLVNLGIIMNELQNRWNEMLIKIFS